MRFSWGVCVEVGASESINMSSRLALMRQKLHCAVTAIMKWYRDLRYTLQLVHSAGTATSRDGLIGRPAFNLRALIDVR